MVRKRRFVSLLRASRFCIPGNHDELRSRPRQCQRDDASRSSGCPPSAWHDAKEAGLRRTTNFRVRYLLSALAAVWLTAPSEAAVEKDRVLFDIEPTANARFGRRGGSGIRLFLRLRRGLLGRG